MKKIIKLINNERKTPYIGSLKATGCLPEDICADPSADYCDSTSNDECLFIDLAHCRNYSNDDCLKDYRACNYRQNDYCDYIDVSICSPVYTEDLS